MDEQQHVGERATEQPEPKHTDDAVSGAGPEDQDVEPRDEGLLSDLRNELDKELHPSKGVGLWRVIRGAMPF
jgi:hypothetical protein